MKITKNLRFLFLLERTGYNNGRPTIFTIRVTPTSLTFFFDNKLHYYNIL